MNNLELVEKIISLQGRALKRVFHPVVDYADIAQEMRLWAWEHRHTIQRWLDEEDEDEPSAERRIARRLRDAGMRYCVKEKAAREGFKASDLHWYDKGVVRRALEVYLSSGLVSEPPMDMRLGGRPSSLSEGGNWQATVLDISRVFTELPDDLRELLMMRYGDGMTERKICIKMGGWSREQVHARIERGVRKMLDALGGETPWTQGRDEAA